MTDTQESVVVNQTTNGQIFGFIRRLVNNYIAPLYKTIAAVVVLGAALYYYQAIISLEARFETTVEKMLDKREQDSKAFMREVIQKFETNMVGKFDVLRRLLVSKNCAEVYKSGRITSGVYTIKLDGAGRDFEVFCDQETAGGGWIVIQKRFDGTIGFHRSWSDYKNGFGNIDGEFWLGLEKIHRLTKSPSKLRVDLEDFDGNTAYAEYEMFVVATESKKYQLSVEKYSGTAGDSLTRHHGYPFTTMNRDHDSADSNCADTYKGGWWYFKCYVSNLNGIYRDEEDLTADGVDWISWKGRTYSLKRAEMKIRPVDF